MAMTTMNMIGKLMMEEGSGHHRQDTEAQILGSHLTVLVQLNQQKTTA